MQTEFIDVEFVKGRCIIVSAKLHSFDTTVVNAFHELNFILDTGATSTHISKASLHYMGYTSSMFTQDTQESFSITGKYTARLCKVRRLDFCGLALRNRTVKVWEPPSNHHVKGVIGMDILRHFNITIDMDTQRAIIERSQAAEAILRGRV
jgi:predicted aspartyl protease